MASNVRLTIDSILDKDRVRILISTDQRTEKDFVVTKSDLNRLLKERIEKYAEGLVFIFDDRENRVPKFLEGIDALKTIPDEFRRIPPIPKIENIEDVTIQKHKRIQDLLAKLRQRMEGLEE